jgi:hypothetical protein
MFRGLRPRLLAEVSSGAATCPLATSGSWTTGIKKGLAALGTQLDSCISKACSCVTETPADMQVATMWLYSVVSAHLTTPGHGYNGDMTR